MEHLVVPTFVLDAERRVLIWNRACERLTGVTAREVLGTTDHWRAFYAEERPCLADLVVARRYLEAAALYASNNFGISDFGVSAENWCVMPRREHQLYLAIDAGPIYDETGQLVAAVETLRDITVQKQAQTELEGLATRDGLTGLANRRSFDEKLMLEAKRAQRTEEPLGLLMIDVDYFKKYNDTYGHQRGDDCLKAVAQAIAGTPMRANDLVARYGGEEFAAILPNTGADALRRVAERLRTSVADLLMPHCSSQVAEHVTVSIGGCAAADCVSSTLLAEADSALYRAKCDGRNRVVISSL